MRHMQKRELEVRVAMKIMALLISVRAIKLNQGYQASHHSGDMFATSAGRCLTAGDRRPVTGQLLWTLIQQAYFCKAERLR